MPDGGPVPKLKPPPTSAPKESPKPFFSSPHRSDEPEQYPVGSVNTPPPRWEAKTAEAAQRARNLIQTVQKQLLATQPPYFKPPPKGLEYLAITKPKVPPPPPCPVLPSIERLNGYDPLPPPPKEKSAPKGRISARIPGSEKAAIERAGARREKEPPIKVKGSVKDYMNKMMRKPSPKPPPGFPPGSSQCAVGVHFAFRWTMLYQPALLPQNMISPQTAAINLGQQSIPVPTQVVVVNRQIMLTLAPTGNAVNNDSRAAADTSYSQASEEVMRLKCSFCNTADASHYPLKVSWFEGDDGFKVWQTILFQ
eukprot:3719476-Amphidinium_carterae.2